MTPPRLTNPIVGLMPTRQLRDEGPTIEPSVSVPIAAVQRFADADTPDPELDPPGTRSSAYGLRQKPPRPPSYPRPLHPGVPRANYMAMPFQILHSDKAVFIAYEYAGAVRNVLLKDPGAAPIDSWMGQSVGVWEGDTFVVTVTGFNDQSWFDRAGNHHSDKLKVVERYTPQGPDHLWYEATIEDPATFSKPWKMRFPLYRHINPDARLNQFKCVEFVEELMYGKYRKQPVQ